MGLFYESREGVLYHLKNEISTPLYVATTLGLRVGGGWGRLVETTGRGDGGQDGL